MNEKQAKHQKAGQLIQKIKHFFGTIPGLYIWFGATLLLAFIFLGASVMSAHSVLLIYHGKEDLVYQAFDTVQQGETDVFTALTAFTMGAIFFAYAAVLGHRDLKDIGVDIRELEKERKEQKKDKA